MENVNGVADAYQSELEYADELITNNAALGRLERPEMKFYGGRARKL